MKTSSFPIPSQRTDQPQRSERPERNETSHGQRAGRPTERDHTQQQAQQIRETVTHEEIARRAHELWEQDGQPHGRDQEHWIEAEKQLRGSTFRKTAEAETGDGDAHAQARAIKASAERRQDAQTRN